MKWIELHLLADGSPILLNAESIIAVMESQGRTGLIWDPKDQTGAYVKEEYEDVKEMLKDV